MILAGVDGCPAGWIAVILDTETSELSSLVVATFGELFEIHPGIRIVAVDIPIGLTDSGPRDCDMLVRGALGNRASSVFPSPIRAVLGARSQSEASDISFAIQGRKVSAQAFGIFAKIKQVDDLLRERPELRAQVYEVHPEFCFAAWNAIVGRQQLSTIEEVVPMRSAKKTPEGFEARARRVSSHFGAGIFETLRARYPKSSVADDDLLDAFAALWTAGRIARGEAIVCPSAMEFDSTGLRMAMWA